MKIERICKPKFEKVPLNEWLEFPREEIDETPDFFEDYRDNLIKCAKDRLELSRWLTWDVQAPEIANESATGLRYASKMYAAFLKLAEHP
ncbi:hypothetical protein V5096_17930, partial [Pseudoalteromonas carrageenovora]|uniref:hypothetical protein n=1 Tax=Pseudoalteromonas carrageenovora TaxID=227 RepID=UPI002FD6FC90